MSRQRVIELRKSEAPAEKAIRRFMRRATLHRIALSGSYGLVMDGKGERAATFVMGPSFTERSFLFTPEGEVRAV